MYDGGWVGPKGCARHVSGTYVWPDAKAPRWCQQDSPSNASGSLEGYLSFFYPLLRLLSNLVKLQALGKF